MKLNVHFTVTMWVRPDVVNKEMTLWSSDDDATAPRKKMRFGINVSAQLFVEVD
jgi:hypothetical protein